MKPYLDEKLIELSQSKTLINEYHVYKKIKTDIYSDDKIMIQMGVDGVDYIAFETNLSIATEHIARRLREEKHFFSPFREVIISKEPNLSVKEAIEAEKTRVLSIGTIKDVIVQRIIYKAIEHYSEEVFGRLKNTSFAYRKQQSAPAAARLISSYVKEGYCHVLDADLSKFFDTIPHEKLDSEIGSFFGEENQLIKKYLRRFFSADRVEWDSYQGNVKNFYKKKPKRIIRKEGIPQGGVLSGLLANVYMHQFDKWVTTKLSSEYGCKYVRYADDFVLMFKTESHIEEVFNKCKAQLLTMGLKLHELGSKSQILNLSYEGRKTLEFVGFAITPKYIRVREANILKFKKRISNIINKCEIRSYRQTEDLKFIIKHIRFKVLGNEEFHALKCEICEKTKSKKSWLSYFLSITDVRQLKSLDTWIRKQVYTKYYLSTNKRLSNKLLRDLELPSIEETYYTYHKELGKIEHCHCDCIVEYK